MEILKVLEDGDVVSAGALTKHNEEYGSCEVIYADNNPDGTITRESLKDWYLIFGPSQDEGSLYLAVTDEGEVRAEMTYTMAHEPPRDLSCGDCKDPCPRVFMVQDDLWVWHIQGPDILCLWCAEKRLGRPFTPFDFTDCPANLWVFEAFRGDGLVPEQAPPGTSPR